LPQEPVTEAKTQGPASDSNSEKPAGSLAVGWKREEPQPNTNALSSSPDAMAKPIISPVASRQVAAAFGQLSEAFALRANRTFDEMAEQMLRPMLQEWLDNNLPVLVERLVREEIERVARGI
jgi:cell pole-organizing protein PopZ